MCILRSSANGIVGQVGLGLRLGLGEQDQGKEDEGRLVLGRSSVARIPVRILLENPRVEYSIEAQIPVLEYEYSSTLSSTRIYS